MGVKETRWFAVMTCLLMLAFAPQTQACRLLIFTGEERKEIQQTEAGNEAVREVAEGCREFLTVQFLQSHRNCPIKADETKLKAKGIQILEESEWETVRNGVYEKTLMVEYTQKGLAVFTVERSCSRGGGKYELIIEVK